MKAARHQDGSVVIVDVPVPEPGPNEALIAIRAAGVCHSDLHLARGDWRPFGSGGPLGHEAIGVVEALGPGTQGSLGVGDRVILGLGGGAGYWCGTCRYCLAGKPRMCPERKGTIGTFAEHYVAWAPALVRLPDTVGDLEAPLACGGLTAYGAVKKLTAHRVRPGRPVAIIGAAGGLGHYAVQLAGAFGYRVVGVDVGAERLNFVRALGATVAVEPADARSAADACGGVDAALVFTARMAGFTLGLELLGKCGLFVAVGIPPSNEGPLSIDPWRFFTHELTLVYSATGSVQDMRELVDLADAGVVRTTAARVAALSELPAVFDELEAARFLGRAVITDLAH